MLSNQYFYHQLTRKYVVIFGNMFNNITIIRKDKDDGSEIERFKIPLIYAPKEKYYARLQSDPDLQRELQVSLPRMSFELTSFSYDPSRKQNSLLKNNKANTSSRLASQYMGVPYDLGFELNLYSRNIDDGTHIVEQILPYFNPDYTITATVVPEIGITKDIPLILTGVTNNIEHEGNFDAVRFVTWRLQFTMKANYFGPVAQTGIIRKVDTNIYNDPKLQAGYIIRINTNSGNDGIYGVDDIVYQGNTFTTATATARVVSWNKNNGKLVLGSAQGTFNLNTDIKNFSSNAVYNLASFENGPLKLVNIHIEPKPNTAQPGDDYGYTTTITEWPNT